MGSIIVCIGCYCCLLNLKPISIEIIALFANLFEIGFLIWGIVDIPWDDMTTGAKVCFYITCGLILLTFFLLLIIMCLRCSGNINTTKNGIASCLCITTLIFDILAFILIIISECLILYKMWDIDDDSGYWGHRHRHRSNFSDTEWACAVISLSVAELGILVHSYCISFLLKLIHLKTNLSYREYMDSVDKNVITDSNIITTRAINVFQSPPNINNNLTLLGYDKDGHPIYSGNTTYQIVNAPIVTNPNLNNINTNPNNNVINNNINNNNNNKGDGK